MFGLLQILSGLFPTFSKLFRNKFFIYLLLGLLLLTFGCSLYFYVHHKGYEEGKADATLEIKQQLEFQQKLFDQERIKLNIKLTTLNEDFIKAQKELEEKKKPLIEKVYVYAKNHPESAPCIDDEWLHIYTNSLPK